MDSKFIFDKKIFAERIRQARRNRNLTQEALSTMLDINVNTLAKCESPRNKLALSYTNLIELVNALDIDVNYLFRAEKNEAERNEAMRCIHSLFAELTEKEQKIVRNLINSLIENRQ